MYQFSESGDVVGPVDGQVVPRYAGPPTFARLPRIDQVTGFDVAILGVPFDTGTTYRPGARFGPQAIRAGSRLLRRYHPHMDSEPFHDQQVVDAGDVSCNPFDLVGAMDEVDRAATELIESGQRLVTLGGDHTIALPLLRAMERQHGPVALVHFDAHLDTWDSYFGSSLTHGTPFRRASEEGLFVPGHSMHIGIRGPVSARQDLVDDAAMGFSIVGTWETEEIGVAGLIEKIRQRVNGYAVYLSIDIDVLDPAFAPGTGTPEIGGFSTRELASIIRGLSGLPVVGLDVVEVSPAYDHAEITALAAANLAYDVVSLMAAETDPGSNQITERP